MRIVALHTITCQPGDTRVDSSTKATSDGEIQRPGWVYAVLALVIVSSLALPFVLVALLT